MDFEKIRKLALQNTPKINLKNHPNYFRHDVIASLKENNCIGIELGVAGGHFSSRMIKSGKFKKFYGVDLYEDHHNVDEYIKALKFIGLLENYVLIRMSFEEAINLFEDNFFDFIYFDGYAHTGEEGGKFFTDWYKKLKIGGVFAGDDYSDEWPLVKWAVNYMVQQLGCELNITGRVENTHLNKYPSWFFIKEKNIDFQPNKTLLELGSNLREATRKKIH